MTAEDRALAAAQERLIDLQRRNLGAEKSDFERWLAAVNNPAAQGEAARQQLARNMFNYRYAMADVPLPQEIFRAIGDTSNTPLGQPGARYAIELPSERIKREIDVADMQRAFAEQGLQLDINDARIAASLANASRSGGGSSSGSSSSKLTVQKAAPSSVPQSGSIPAPVGEFEAVHYDAFGQPYSVDLPGSMGPVEASWVRSMAERRGLTHLITGNLLDDVKMIVANWNNFQNVA